MSRNDSRSVSVIIPTYNRASLLGHTIDNMVAQTLSPHEIIVVDDGSTDRTRETVARYGDRVRYVCQRNMGPAAARNTGLAMATGRFIQFMDSDDLASLNKLEVQVEAIEEDSAEMAYGPWIQLAMERNTAECPSLVIQSAPVPGALPLHEWHLRGWALTLQNCLFTRQFLERAGRLREDLVMTEDTEYLSRIFLAGPKVTFRDSCLVLYRLHASDKLTGGGTTDVHKLIHWARALRYILEDLESSGKRLGVVTRFRLSHQIWRVRNQLNEASPSDWREFAALDGALRQYPNIAFAGFSLWARVAGALRSRIKGTHWPRPFRTRRVGPTDLRLIREAGIQFEQDSGQSASG